MSFDFLFVPVRGLDDSPRKFRHDIQIPLALASFSLDRHLDVSSFAPLRRLREQSPDLLVNGQFESAWALVSDVQNSLMNLNPHQLRRFSLQASDWMIMAATATMSSRFEQATAWCQHSIRVGSASPIVAADALAIYGICMSRTLLKPTSQRNAIQLLQSAYQQHLSIGAISAAITDLCSLAVVEFNSVGRACAEATMELVNERLQTLQADNTAQAVSRFIAAFGAQCKIPRTENTKAFCAG
ncbi:MAG: hypothetical protein JNL58_13855 [Planctomyces sp.]|nr:hypothetical protein [Planctomyces sp.]